MVVAIGYAETPSKANPAAATIAATRDTKRAAALVEEAKAMHDRWDRRPQNRAPLKAAQAKLMEAEQSDPLYAPLYVQIARSNLLFRYAYSSDETVAADAIANSEASLNHALELDPRLADAYIMLADLHQVSGDIDKASAALDSAQKLGSKNPWLEIERALLAIRAKGGGDPSVQAHLKAALKQARSANDAHSRSAAAYGLARFLEAKGDKVKAAVLYKEAEQSRAQI